MQNRILQGSPEWLTAKQSKIGASEIYTLVAHYCRKELEAMGFDLMKGEKPFRTIQEIFLKIKFGAKLDDIDPMHAEFGNGMESYVAYRLSKQLPDLKVERSKDFVLNENLHPLAACSPDGFVETVVGINDFDKTCEINFAWGRGALELKTANYFDNFGAEKGSKLQYIFQNQYQQMVLGLKWGVLAVLMPKEKEFDEPFFKGKTLGKLTFLLDSDQESELDQYYDLHHYIYPNLPIFQAMILKALTAFQDDLDAYDTDESVFPRNSEDLLGLQREKRLWAQLWPDNKEFGVKTLQARSELDRLFTERYETKVQLMFVEQAFELVDIQIRQKLKLHGLDKYCEIIGTGHRAIFTKNGQLRFYENK